MKMAGRHRWHARTAERDLVQNCVHRNAFFCRSMSMAVSAESKGPCGTRNAVVLAP